MIEDFEWRHGHTPLSSYQSLVACVALYMLAVAVLPRMMKRPLAVPVSLSAVHNCILCFGSAVMFAGAAIETYKGPLYFWSYVYYLSKYYELLDTLLLICKNVRAAEVQGKRLSFLHVFHHATVVIMAYLWLDAKQSLQQVALLTNTAVHVVMYWYYLMCTLKRPPRWKQLITTLQIGQFCYSFLISIPFFICHVKARRPEEKCSGFDAWLFNAVFNTALLGLFMNFHKRNYSKKKPS